MNPLPTYACIHIRELPAQALLRLSNPAPGPIAVLDGKPPAGTTLQPQPRRRPHRP